MNENENGTYQNLQHAVKAVFGWSCITVNTYIKKKDHKSIT